MTHSIDASFRQKKQERLQRRRRMRWRKILAGLALVVLASLGVGFYVTADYWSFGDLDENLTVTEQSDEMAAGTPVYVPAIVDLPGDPMWINIAGGGDAAPKGRSIPRPADLTQPGISPTIEMMGDTMLSSSERFMTTIPATQEDFAFFQAQRATIADPHSRQQAGLSPVPKATETPVGPPTAASSPDAAAANPDAGWGEPIDGGEAELSVLGTTEIENNTSVAIVTPENERYEATQDAFVKILNNRSLESVITDAHFSVEEAKAAGEALKTLFHRDTLEPGFVVAMRGYRPRREATTRKLMQVSVYTQDMFVGTLTRDRAGSFVIGVDPWVRDDLFYYSGSAAGSGLTRRYRLLDAIYSTAVRNNVPTSVIGEAIMYLSRGQDLNAFATYDERLLLIYSDTPRDEENGSGRVLYVGVHGGEKSLECFVFRQSDGQFACVTGDDKVQSVTIAMVTPVNGVMTSPFGPRKHPILGSVHIHKGVDWTAPAGTPVFAVYDGKIVFQGDGGSYGNLVRIEHTDGRETRYAHLQRFALENGRTVKAGDIIGYVGTTGLSTGPHLHFELYQGTEAIDPLGTIAVAASGDSVVETLTNRIIHVESGGSARAKNPLSTATGLGQFITRTWIRMMNTYRPDLARSLSTTELLALRFDPTLSREMVRNLAHEGEAYLRARGHQITAGRLYLCHFLGMEGASQVLSAPSDALLVSILGPQVVQANPFLIGKTTGYVVDWAERKMRGHAWAATETREIRQTSPEFEKYKRAMVAIIQSAEETL